MVHVESSNNDFSDNGSAFNMMSWDYDVDVNVEAFEVPEVDVSTHTHCIKLINDHNSIYKVIMYV